MAKGWRTCLFSISMREHFRQPAPAKNPKAGERLPQATHPRAYPPGAWPVFRSLQYVHSLMHRYFIADLVGAFYP